MKRIHLFEFEDLKWFPAFLRNYLTDFLQYVANRFKRFESVLPILEKGLISSNDHIIDLASGGGGGLLWLNEELKANHPDLKITLTDYFPNTDAFEYTKAQSNNFSYIDYPVDARKVPNHLLGLRTQFLAFHHFRPKSAKRILQDAIDSNNSITIIEAQERSVSSLITMLCSPLTVLYTTPFIRPFKWGRLIFTYLIPIVPFIVLWDGIVSSIRTYSLDEMKSFVNELENKDNFDWEFGKIKSGFGVNLYLLGTLKKKFRKEKLTPNLEMNKEVIKNKTYSYSNNYIKSGIIEIDKKKRLNTCVIIPTYNNEKTLAEVINAVLSYSKDVFVVNDGSTDSTKEILNNFRRKVTVIDLFPNEGKGKALRVGFDRALSDGFDYAITIDSDGQHFADDIPLFIKALEKDPEALLIGSRNMTHESVPKNSSFGNRFSNFWFWFETGFTLTDTQSGFRCYPLKELNKIKFYTKKFEFEIESIVRASWNGVPVKNIPIKVLYSDERVSHFRPIKDFARISVLNTILVSIAICYIKPRNFLRKIRKKGIKRFLVENVLQSDDSPGKKAYSIALGVFIGIAPLWGLQTILVLALATLFKLNRLIAFTFSNISIPPMIPLIVYGSLKVGHWLVGIEGEEIEFGSISTDTNLLKSLKEYIIGSFALATITAISFGLIAYTILKLRKIRIE